MSLTIEITKQGDEVMVGQEEQISHLAAEIEKSIRTAERLKLDFVVYVLMMARLEIENLHERS